jgi:hypothetical protein
MCYSLFKKACGAFNPLCCFFALLLFIASQSKAQSVRDTGMVQLQKANAIGLYYQSLQHQSGLYNGSEYVQYINLLKEGHPYFDTSALTNGSVYYDGLVYSNVPMLYDIITDELIIGHYNKVFLVQLIRSKIDSFSIQEHHFLHLGRDSIAEGIREGFYDRIYNGSIKLYVKRKKVIRESIPDMQVERRVFQDDRYFLYMNGVYHNVYSQSSILKLMKDKRSVVKQTLRKHKIKFRKNREYAMKLMTEQYDALNR